MGHYNIISSLMFLIQVKQIRVPKSAARGRLTSWFCLVSTYPVRLRPSSDRVTDLGICCSVSERILWLSFLVCECNGRSVLRSVTLEMALDAVSRSTQCYVSWQWRKGMSKAPIVGLAHFRTWYELRYVTPFGGFGGRRRGWAASSVDRGSWMTSENRGMSPVKERAGGLENRKLDSPSMVVLHARFLFQSWVLPLLYSVITWLDWLDVQLHAWNGAREVPLPQVSDE
ncbi:hypothetical protein F4861DRAFT_370642 [Xylaria intraflava]|nr:hypothetical protein F4861DRAFT_370642 [Xylaria intraflava]